jgi:hypothetical protein
MDSGSGSGFAAGSPCFGGVAGRSGLVDAAAEASVAVDAHGLPAAFVDGGCGAAAGSVRWAATLGRAGVVASDFGMEGRPAVLAGGDPADWAVGSVGWAGTLGRAGGVGATGGIGRRGVAPLTAGVTDPAGRTGVSMLASG